MGLVRRQRIWRDRRPALSRPHRGCGRGRRPRGMLTSPSGAEDCAERGSSARGYVDRREKCASPADADGAGLTAPAARADPARFEFPRGTSRGRLGGRPKGRDQRPRNPARASLRARGARTSHGRASGIGRRSSWMRAPPMSDARQGRDRSTAGTEAFSFDLEDAWVGQDRRPACRPHAGQSLAGTRGPLAATLKPGWEPRQYVGAPDAERIGVGGLEENLTRRRRRGRGPAEPGAQRSGAASGKGGSEIDPRLRGRRHL